MVFRRLALATNNRSGWLRVQTLVRLLAFILAHAIELPQRNCGNPCRQSTAQAIAYTDFWAAYGAVLPSKRHRAVGKETGFTSLVERFNNTLRQRVSRLVRKTLSNSCVVRESHWGNLVFRALLQCIITCLALPILGSTDSFLANFVWLDCV